MLDWTGDYAAVGFNVLGHAIDFRQFENHGLSRTPDIEMVACNHSHLNRPWTNVIYRIGVSVNDEQLNRSRCLSRVAYDEEFYPIQTEDLDFLPGFLLDCPCTIFQANTDFRFFLLNSPQDPRDRLCYYSRFARRVSGVFLVNRCCYFFRYSHTIPKIKFTILLLHGLSPSVRD